MNERKKFVDEKTFKTAISELSNKIEEQKKYFDRKVVEYDDTIRLLISKIESLSNELSSMKKVSLQRDDLIALDQVYRHRDGKRVVHTNQEFLDKNFRNKSEYKNASRLGYVIKTDIIDKKD
jgi:hypothetical protein